MRTRKIRHTGEKIYRRNLVYNTMLLCCLQYSYTLSNIIGRHVGLLHILADNRRYAGLTDH